MNQSLYQWLLGCDSVRGNPTSDLLPLATIYRELKENGHTADSADNWLYEYTSDWNPFIYVSPYAGIAKREMIKYMNELKAMNREANSTQ